MWRSPVAYMAGGHVVAGSNPVIPTECKMIQRSWIIFYFQTCQKHSFCKRLQIKNEIDAIDHFPFAMRVYKDSANPGSICKCLEIKNEIDASDHFPFAMRVYKDYLNPVIPTERKVISH